MQKTLFSRNFVLLLLGQASSLLGNYTLKFALSMYVLERTGSASIFAGMLALAMLPTILLSPLGGILADRANRRNVMVALDGLSGTGGLPWLPRVPAGRSPRNRRAVGGFIRAGRLRIPHGAGLRAPNAFRGGHCARKRAGQPGRFDRRIGYSLSGSVFYTAVGIRAVFFATAACFFLTAGLEGFFRLEYQKPAKKMGNLRHPAGRFFRKRTLFPAGTARNFQAFAVGRGGEPVCRGNSGCGLSLSRAHGAGPFRRTLRRGGSAMGVASILGSFCVAISAKKLRPRHLSAVFAGFGICLIPCGAAFLLPLYGLSRYLILLGMFCVCQFGCSLFSTYAVSAIQERTPQHLMGKVMACVFTLSLCAQPVGQIAYGALFDRFSDQVHWVLLPSGVLVCAIGLLSRGFFRNFEKSGKQ